MAEENLKLPLVPALTLSGGGARSAYQVGVLRALGEILPQEQIPFPILCGTSAGSVNVAYLAARAGSWQTATTELSKIWGNLRLDDIYETNGLAISKIATAWISRTLLGGLGATSGAANYLLDTKPLEKLIRREIDFSAIETHLHKGRLEAISVSTVEYFAQSTVSFYASHTRVLDWSHSGRRSQRCALDRRHVLASAAIPVFFPPVKIDKTFYGDGCLRQTSPLSPAIHLGASRILSVGIRPFRGEEGSELALSKRRPPSLAEILGEMLNALFLDSIETDIERAERINSALADLSKHKGFAFSRPLRPVPILHLAPSQSLTELMPEVIDRFPALLAYCIKGLGVSESKLQGKELLSYLAFLPECTQPLMELGYTDTLKRKHDITAFMASDLAQSA